MLDPAHDVQDCLASELQPGQKAKHCPRCRASGVSHPSFDVSKAGLNDVE